MFNAGEYETQMFETAAHNKIREYISTKMPF